MYDYGMYSVNLWLMALVCLERYLSIFFQHFIMKNQQRRFFIYHLSAIAIILFVLFWYLYLISLYPCTQNQFVFTQMLCGFPCYKVVGSPILLNTDWAIADLLPVFLTILFIVILILHFLYQKYKMSRYLMRQESWKRTRKMFLQLLPILFLFLIFNMPLIIVGLLAISHPWFNTIPYFYANSLSYCLPLFIPFAILSKQTEIRKRLAAILTITQFNRTVPVTLAAPQMQLATIQTAQRINMQKAPIVVVL